jgi:hypothetical protein
MQFYSDIFVLISLTRLLGTGKLYIVHSVQFPVEGFLLTETCKNIQCDIVT